MQRGRVGFHPELVHCGEEPVFTYNFIINIVLDFLHTYESANWHRPLRPPTTLVEVIVIDPKARELSTVGVACSIAVYNANTKCKCNVFCLWSLVGLLKQDGLLSFIYLGYYGGPTWVCVLTPCLVVHLDFLSKTLRNCAVSSLFIWAVRSPFTWSGFTAASGIPTEMRNPWSISL